VCAGTTNEPTAEGAERTVHATVSGQAAPTLHQWELGMLLGSLRAERGLTVEEVARTLVCPPSRVRQLEAAASPPTLEELSDLRALFKLDDATANELTELTRSAQQQGWWAEYEDLGVPYLGFEQHASSITSYTMSYFPALLQTVDYARAIITAIAPRIEPRILEQRVEARLRRQHVLSGEYLQRYAVLLDEAVLHRPMGGPTIMREQLDKVLTMAQARTVSLQIVPFERGAYAAQDSNFILLQFDEPGPSAVIYVEGLVADHLLRSKEEVDRYREAVEHLKQSALNFHDSVHRIEQARDTYRDS